MPSPIDVVQAISRHVEWKWACSRIGVSRVDSTLSHQRQRRKKMSKVLRTMVVVGALSLGIGNLFGQGAKQSTAVKEDTKTTAGAQSNAPATDKATGKKKATTHHAKQ